MWRATVLPSALQCMVLPSGLTPGSQAPRAEKMEDLTATQVPLSNIIVDCILTACKLAVTSKVHRSLPRCCCAAKLKLIFLGALSHQLS